MPHSLQLSSLARSDVQTKFNWLRLNRSTKFADRWYATMEKALETIAANPNRFPSCDESEHLNIEMKYMQFGQKPAVYRVIFTISEDAVLVQRVLHSSQHWGGENNL